MDKSDKQDKRIIKILGAGNLGVTLESLTLYREYLRKHLETPCTMTGIEDLQWEDKHSFGYADETDSEVLNNNRPSSTDVYELKRFEELIDEDIGILVKVKRVKDNRRFILDLKSLKAVDKASENYMLIDDYATWFGSNR